MEDFIEIIFYVVILVLSGIGSLLKNRKKQEKDVSASKTIEESHSAEYDLGNDVVRIDEPKREEDDELARMLREVVAQQRSREAFEQQQRNDELRQKERESRLRKAELLRIEREKELAKQQQKMQNKNLEVDNDVDNSVFGLDLSDINEVKRAFITSEILNKKHF